MTGGHRAGKEGSQDANRICPASTSSMMSLDEGGQTLLLLGGQND